jgi:hypothetical protein
VNPARGEVFLDPRGGDRSLRVTWHGERGVVVLSLWRDSVCTGSFRLEADELPRFIRVLAEVLSGEPPVAGSAPPESAAS